MTMFLKFTGLLLLSFLVFLTMSPITLALQQTKFITLNPSWVSHSHSDPQWHYQILANTHPANGTQKLLIILVEFPDVHHKTSSDQIRKIAVDQLNAYYQEVSYGRVSVTGEIYGWFTMPHDMKYYGHDKSATDVDVNIDQLASDALSALPKMDLSSFTFLLVVHAGQDESYTNVSDDIWSECSCSVFPNYQAPSPVRSGSKTFPDHGTLSEFDGYGTYAHELGHHFGLPDLYDASDDYSYIGFWSLMDSGNWCCYNQEQDTPSYIGAWGAALLGWITPTVADETAVLTSMDLRPLESSSPAAILIPISSHTYYFIEDRVQKGADSHLPSSGILVYFVDELLETGYGIVRLVNPDGGKIMAANEYPDKFNTAIFESGGKFSDPIRSVYLAFLGQVSGYTTLFSKQELAGSVLQSNLQLLTPNNLTEIYNQQFNVEGVLSDQNGSPLVQQTVEAEILDPSSALWQIVGTSVTDSQGRVSVTVSENYSTGIYRFRLFYPGGDVNGSWHFSTTAENPLQVTPAPITMTLSAPSIVTPGGLQVEVQAATSDGKPIAGALVTLLIDGSSKYTLNSDANGIARFTLSLGLVQLGSHTITTRITNPNYLSTTQSTTVIVAPPLWLVAIVIVALVSFGVIVVKTRMYRREVLMMHCSECGRRIPRDSDFCPECGMRISNNS